MSELTPRESELVSLAAALSSNCLPCIQRHIPEARKAGLTDAEIRAAVELADQVRQVPARLVLDAARSALEPAPACAGSPGTPGQGCAGSPPPAVKTCC
jgi:4-carboxymuconolactone decarboxylase